MRVPANYGEGTLTGAAPETGDVMLTYWTAPVISKTDETIRGIINTMMTQDQGYHWDTGTLAHWLPDRTTKPTSKSRQPSGPFLASKVSH